MAEVRAHSSPSVITSSTDVASIARLSFRSSTAARSGALGGSLCRDGALQLRRHRAQHDDEVIYDELQGLAGLELLGGSVHQRVDLFTDSLWILGAELSQRAEQRSLDSLMHTPRLRVERLPRRECHESLADRMRSLIHETEVLNRIGNQAFARLSLGIHGMSDAPCKQDSCFSPSPSAHSWRAVSPAHY